MEHERYPVSGAYEVILRGYVESNAQPGKRERVASKARLINSYLPNALGAYKNKTESFYDDLILTWLGSVESRSSAARSPIEFRGLIDRLKRKYTKASRAESYRAARHAQLFNQTTDVYKQTKLVYTLYADVENTIERASGLVIKEWPVVEGTNLHDAALIAMVKGGPRANIEVETANGRFWRPAKDIAAGVNPETGEYSSGSGVSFGDATARTISGASYATHGSCEEDIGKPYRSTKGGLELLHLPSKNDECLTAIFRNMSGDNRYCKSISRELALTAGPKGPEDIAKLAAKYDLYARVFVGAPGAAEFLPVAVYGNESRPTLDILCAEGHYTRILSGTPQAGAINHIQAEQAKRNYEFVVDTDSDDIADPQTNDFGPIIDKIVSERADYFISGPGGVGKSFLLRGIMREMHRQGYAVFATASTGVAAVRIGGMTIYSFVMRHHNGDKKLACSRLDNKAVIIDECSMLAATTMGEFISYLRKEKFRLIIAADECQIPPVDHSDSNGYFFQCDEFQDFRRVSLTKLRRTDNLVFGAASLKIRLGNFDDSVKQFLASVPTVSEASMMEITLTPSDLYIAHANKVVDAFNELNFKKNPNEIRKFPPIMANNAPKWLMDRCREKGRIVWLKVGNRVVITKNHRSDSEDPTSERLYNGMLGTVVNFDDNGGLPVVRMDIDGRCFTIDRISNTRNSQRAHNGKKKFEVRYLPLRLAYALTIHKAQGSTVSGRLFFNLSFCNYLEPCEKLGLFYTGISRATDSKNLFFVGAGEPLEGQFSLNKTIGLWLEGKNVPNQSEIAACYALGESMDFSILEGAEPEPIEDVSAKRKPACPDTVIYYDFETAKRAVGSQIEPYLCSMVIENKPKDGPMVQTSKVFCDILGSPPPMTFTACVADAVLDTISHICTDFERDSIGYLPKKRNKEYRDKVRDLARYCPRLCAYNGAKFDLYFLFNKILGSARWFPKEHYVPLIILKSSTIISLRIINKTYGFPVLISHDIVQVAPMTLADACKSFLPGEPAKIDFHDQIMALSDIRYAAAGLAGAPWKAWTEERDYTIKKYPSALVKGGGGLRVMQQSIGRFRPSDVIEYCCRDTDVLQRLYHAEDAAVKGLTTKGTPLGVFDFLTCGSLTWSNFIRDAQPMFGDGTRKLYSVNSPMNDFIRKSIYGGRSLPRITFGEADGSGEMVYLDISAMYASIMCENKFPFGLPEWIDQTKANELVNKVVDWAQRPNGPRPLARIWALPCFFIARVEYEERRSSLEPVIPVKTKAGTKYILERRSAILTSLDIALIVAKGGRIFSVGELLSFPYSDYLCRPWVAKCVEGKKKYGKSALGVFYKLLGNAAYGQQLKRDHLNHWAICSKPEETEQFLKQYDWDSYLSVGDVDILYGRDKNAKKRYLSSRAPYVGSFVLAYSRLMLQHIISVINPNEDPALQPALGDTDSLLVPKSALGRLMDAGIIPRPGEPVLPGMMADEIADTIVPSSYIPEAEKPRYKGLYWTVSRWFSPAPKVLAVECVDPVNGDLYYKYRTKGISANSGLWPHPKGSASGAAGELPSASRSGGQRPLCSAKSLFESIPAHKLMEAAYLKGERREDDGCEYDMGETLQKIGPNRVSKEERLNADSAFTIKVVEMKRCILTKIWEGRHHIGNGITVPHGWAPKQ